jgi:hypothetical protein
MSASYTKRLPRVARNDVRRALANSPEQGRRASRRTRLQVRTMFVLYSLLIVGGVVFFVTVGLTQQ